MRSARQNVHRPAPWPTNTIPASPAGSHIDDVITDESIKWPEKQKSDGKPFFLNFRYYSVHAPFQAKPELIEKYRAKAKNLPADAPRAIPIMATMIETLDQNIGRISAALDRLGLAENTLLIFTSDNGGNEYNYTQGQLATNNHPLRNGKGNINESGQRVPLIAVWPGKIAPGSRNPSLVSSVDLFPTLLSPPPAELPRPLNPSMASACCPPSPARSIPSARSFATFRTAHPPPAASPQPPCVAASGS